MFTPLKIIAPFLGAKPESGQRDEPFQIRIWLQHPRRADEHGKNHRRGDDAEGELHLRPDRPAHQRAFD